MTLEEQRFLDAFETCRLPAQAWTHTAHIRMAWLCLGDDDFAGAVARIRSGILRYNAEVLDKLAEYHETVTVAFSRIIKSRMRTGDSWESFAERNEDLFARTPSALSPYYSAQLLMSAQARRSFVEPDRRPLPDSA